jgi:broad specificity phosphatase PhoE
MMNGLILASNASTRSISNGDDDRRTYTLYLLRHGEAAHNIQEKVAMKRALENSLTDGLKADSPEARRRMEEARQAVLEDKSFFDAPLSEKGERESAAARQLIQELTCGKNSTSYTSTDDETQTPVTCCWFPPPARVTGNSPFVSVTEACCLPPPTEVLVSPLQRTLQTADLVFPDHCNIRVRDELRERLTGRPADNRMASFLAEQKFSRFSFVHLRLNSFFSVKTMLKPPPLLSSPLPLPFIKKGKKGGMEKCEHVVYDDDDYDDDDCGEGGEDRKEESPPPMPKPSLLNFNKLKAKASQESSFNADQVQEDEDKLRQRTMKLFELLAHSQHDSVAIVTHKGFLRALERGAFGQPHATEFHNCELRVYRFTMSRGCKILDEVERLR